MTSTDITVAAKKQRPLRCEPRPQPRSTDKTGFFETLPRNPPRTRSLVGMPVAYQRRCRPGRFASVDGWIGCGGPRRRRRRRRRHPALDLVGRPADEETVRILATEKAGINNEPCAKSLPGLGSVVPFEFGLDTCCTARRVMPGHLRIHFELIAIFLYYISRLTVRDLPKWSSNECVKVLIYVVVQKHDFIPSR